MVSAWVSNKLAKLHTGAVIVDASWGHRRAELFVSKQSASLFSLPVPSSSMPNISPMMMRMVSRIGSLSFEVTLVIKRDSAVENTVAIPKRQIRSNPAFHQDIAVGRVHMKVQRARRALQRFGGWSPSSLGVCVPRAVVAIRPTTVPMQQSMLPAKVTQ